LYAAGSLLIGCMDRPRRAWKPSTSAYFFGRDPLGTSVMTWLAIPCKQEDGIEFLLCWLCASRVPHRRGGTSGYSRCLSIDQATE